MAQIRRTRTQSQTSRRSTLLMATRHCAACSGSRSQNDGVIGTEDQSVTFDVRANDASLNSLTVSAINGTAITAGGPAISVAHGSVTLGADGQLTFTPAADFFGPATFSYTIANGLGRFSTANATVMVTNVNDAPTDSALNGNPALTRVSVSENSATNTVV